MDKLETVGWRDSMKKITEHFMASDIAENFNVSIREAWAILDNADDKMAEEFDEVPHELKNIICADDVIFNKIADHYVDQAATGK